MSDFFVPTAKATAVDTLVLNPNPSRLSGLSTETDYPLKTTLISSLESKTKSILPEPFSWCEIPAGKVCLGTAIDEQAYGVGETFELSPFFISKYPLTNAQYAQFIEAGGYANRAWWTECGWQTKENNQWTRPHYWKNSRFNGAEQPVVGVSWYESVAFCLWLSATLAENIMLPSEQQWQRAAQNDNECNYPWGNDFDSDNANTEASAIDKTNPVTAYPQGQSIYGVFDMVGNVWEWCLTEYATGSQSLEGSRTRVLHGGAFDAYASFACTTYRDGFDPDYRSINYGFRLCAGSVGLV